MRIPPYPKRGTAPVGPSVLLPGKLHGLRTWELASDASGVLRLISTYCRRPWRTDGETTWAECVHNRRSSSGKKHGGPAPVGHCSCGLYALHPWARKSGYWPEADDRLVIVGVVEAWGKVQLHEEGFRAQYARPVALALIGIRPTSDRGRLVTRLARRHKADVLTVESVGALVAHCRCEKLGLSRSTVKSLLT